MRTIFTAWMVVIGVGWANMGASAVELSGQVQDVDGNGLPGANILLVGEALSQPMGTTTDEGGRYVVKGIPVGVYTVRISYIGYKTVEMERVEIAAGVELDIELHSTAVLLDQSVISASRTKEKALDAPASVSVVEGQAVRDMPVLTVTDHIRHLPAVDFSQTGLVQNNVVVRGFNNIF